MRGSAGGVCVPKSGFSSRVTAGSLTNIDGCGWSVARRSVRRRCRHRAAAEAGASSSRWRRRAYPFDPHHLVVAGQNAWLHGRQPVDRVVDERVRFREAAYQVMLGRRLNVRRIQSRCQLDDGTRILDRIRITSPGRAAPGLTVGSGGGANRYPAKTTGFVRGSWTGRHVVTVRSPAGSIVVAASGYRGCRHRELAGTGRRNMRGA